MVRGDRPVLALRQEPALSPLAAGLDGTTRRGQHQVEATAAKTAPRASGQVVRTPNGRADDGKRQPQQPGDPGGTGPKRQTGGKAGAALLELGTGTDNHTGIFTGISPLNRYFAPVYRGTRHM